MTDTLAHRGPDGEGQWLSENAMVGLGHRRLSIIDLSDAASQPMLSADGRFAMVLNGEIYNYLELKSQLVAAGHVFKSSSDTEVLLNLYAQYGENCLSMLDGMFAFAVYDNVKHELFCARDRFGEKPFFYAFQNSVFYFASEVKALFAAGIPSTVSERHIFEYLMYQTTTHPAHPHTTMYENVMQLEPAHSIVVKENRIEKKKYWEIDLNRRISISENEAVEQFRYLFNLSVQRRLRSDVPVGSSLSGGLDSSAIVTEINKIKGANQIQKTFSARFPGFIKDESVFMDAVIGKTNVDPVPVFPSAMSVLQNLDAIWKHQEFPFGSTSIAIQYEVMKAARENGVIVLMDGQGADETLAGYLFYRKTYLEYLRKNNRALFIKESTALKEIHGIAVAKNSLKTQISNHRFFPNRLARNLKRRTTSSKADFFLGLNPDLVKPFKNEPSPYLNHNTLKEHLFFSTFNVGLLELLRYADRNAMAHSVEVRLPFLFHELVEFIFALPDHLLIHNGWTKYVLRKAMENQLPEIITWRKDKIGYEPPQEDWMKNKEYADLIFTAQNHLHKEKIIIKIIPEQRWQHLMVYYLLNNKLK